MQDEDIQKLRAGDADAWRRLVQAFHRVVVRVLSDMGVAQSSDREDVAQNTWLHVYQGLGTSWCPEKVGKGRSLDEGLKVWIAAIASRCALDYHRRRRRRCREVLPGSLEGAAGAEAPPAAVWQEKLSLREQCVVQFYLDGKDVKEIAPLIGKSEMTVYRILRDVRDKLS